MKYCSSTKRGGKGEKIETWYNVEKKQKTSKEMDSIFLQGVCLLHRFLSGSATVDWNMLTLHLLPASSESLVCRRGTPLAVVTGRKAAMTAGDLL